MESAFTLIPTFALILAFVDMGLSIYRWNTLQNAVREGVRYAITFQTNTSANLGQTESIKAVVERYAMGIVRRVSTPQKIFVCYAKPATPTTCIASGGNIPGNVVQVSVRNVPYDPLNILSGSYSGSAAPVYGNSSILSLNVNSADILGGFPVGVLAVQE